TPIPMRTLVLVSLAGRLPGYVLLSLGGDGLAYDNLDPVVVIGAVVAVAVALAYWKRDRLHEMVSSGDVVGFLRRRWPLSPSMTVVFAVGLVLVTVALYRAAAAVGRGTRGRVPRPGAHIRASGITTARPSTSPAFTASYASTARLSGYSVVCEAISPRAASARTSASSGRVPQ